MEKLQKLLEDGVIDEVYSQLKTGKEAEVWLVSHRGEAVAAKLYKERDVRSFKNDAGYREGRTVRNSRTQRAMEKGSKFGREASEEAWRSAEADAMFALHALGVRVPKPILFYDGVLLMEVIGDAEGRVAPRLVDAGLALELARPLYLELRGQVIRMLAADWIHGDLSEFNVLLGSQGPVIIDFPQVVTAAGNSRAEHYFRRDLGNLLRFLTTLDPAVARHEGDVDDIWRAYVRRQLSPGYVPSERKQGGPPRHHQVQHAAKDSHRPPQDGRRGQQDARPPRGGGGPQSGGRPPPQEGRHAQGGGPRQDARPPQEGRHPQRDAGHPRQDARPPQESRHPGGAGHPRQDARPPQEGRHPRGAGHPRQDARPPQEGRHPQTGAGHPRQDSRPPQGGGRPQQDPRRQQQNPRGQRRGPEVVFRGGTTPAGSAPRASAPSRQEPRPERPPDARQPRTEAPRDPRPPRRDARPPDARSGPRHEPRQDAGGGHRRRPKRRF